MHVPAIVNDGEAGLFTCRKLRMRTDVRESCHTAVNMNVIEIHWEKASSEA
jgi:hypothetical protein